MNLGIIFGIRFIWYRHVHLIIGVIMHIYMHSGPWYSDAHGHC
jgi:hypothetical protein